MDIDIDVPTTFDPLEIFEHITRASMVEKGELKKHTVGTYFQNIPKDRVTELSAIPYKEAEELGYFKIDFLHLSILDIFESKAEIRSLLQKEPDWKMLEIPSIVTKLFQLHEHYELLQQIKPTNVEELADCIAIIRPSKRFLVDKYLKDPVATRKVLYQKANGHYYKKPHAVAYALVIVLQLHLIKGGVL